LATVKVKRVDTIRRLDWLSVFIRATRLLGTAEALDFLRHITQYHDPALSAAVHPGDTAFYRTGQFYIL